MGGAWSIAMGDVTGDGKLDVVTGNLDAKSVSVLVTSGTEPWSRRSTTRWGESRGTWPSRI